MSTQQKSQRKSQSQQAQDTFTNDTNSGLPVVSILSLKKQKEILKKRREALIAGKGRTYRGVGSHRRSTTKHTWTYGELAELSTTFMENYNKKELSKISEEIQVSFANQLEQNQERQERQKQEIDTATTTIDADEEQLAELREPRVHLPSIEAIELKLMDCASLYYNDKRNYISKPSKTHQEVWSHILCALKHREMIRDMAQSKPQSQSNTQSQQSKPKISIKKKETAYETKKTSWLV
jgi:hypothetical protein